MIYRANFAGLIASTTATLFLLTGCVTTKKEPFVLPQQPTNNITAYVDNSYDVERQENAVDSYVWAINSTKSFKVEVNPDPISVADLDMSKKEGYTYISCLNKAINSKLADHIGFVTHNYNYGDYHFTKKDRKIDFYSKSYMALKLNEKSFEIKGFDTKKEAMDIFIQLMRATYKDQTAFATSVVNAPQFSKNVSTDDWDFHTYLPGRGFRYDPVALDKENRLVIIPRILDYSLKNQFENVLKAEGYTVVDKKENAQLLINTKFLYYGTKMDGDIAFKNIDKQLNQSDTKEKKRDVAKQTEQLANEASWASRSGNTAGANAFAGVAAANIIGSLFEGNKYDGYFISYGEIYKDGKKIVSTADYLKLDVNELANPSYCAAESFDLTSSRRFMVSLKQKFSSTN